ncbi:MAG: amidohydrolase family protein [bacterium]
MRVTLLVFILLFSNVLFAHGNHMPTTEGGDESSSAEPVSKGDKDKWDVNHPPETIKNVTVDTKTGTWMSVDVNPDGQSVVFDLLGDIYVLDIKGGEAKAITSGLAWDEQPVFSPDGKWIAFTSDRDGGDNLWIMKEDGTEPHQVTKESFRLLNSPVWTPDGEYLIGRKHFTGSRSAGAGELWMYHIYGGKGVQITKKQNEQKDLGEPAVSPDGQWIYYSKDSTPGDTFSYNKDPNTQIYVINRLNRITGETEQFISGPGGAIRPSPSPDGQKIAFMRRVRYENTLFIKDLVSGNERVIYRGLDRDNQEAWAIHGVYPHISWTPDSKNVVFWSGGQINSLDVNSRKISQIPFHVKQQYATLPTVRFDVPVAPDQFRVQMLRDVQVSPDKKHVLFQALGHIYVRSLDKHGQVFGKAKQMMSKASGQQYYPSWSSDSNSIVYMNWTDAGLGEIKISNLSNKSKTLTRYPGHYRSMSLSPDGRYLVYVKEQGGYLLNPDWSINPGVYVLDLKNNKSHRIATDGTQPQFSTDSQRIYLIKHDSYKAVKLVSVNLNGHDEREHAKGTFTTSMKLSRDERFIAFQEGYKVWVAPFTNTGKAIEVGPDMTGLPVKALQQDSGDYLQFSADGKQLYWTLGETLYSLKTDHLFELKEGAGEQGDAIKPTTTKLGFDQNYAKPAQLLALLGARIITMNNDQVIEHGTIVIKDNKIIAIGDQKGIKIPERAKRIDLTGKTIMPGIVDAHWHGSQGQDGIIPQQNWVNFASLAFGVTTIHDPSNNSHEIFAAAEMQKNGDIVGPRIFSTGTILYGATHQFTAKIDSLDDARAHLKRIKAYGGSSVKSYNQPRRNQRQQVLTAARELHMNVVPEGGSLFVHNMTMVMDGHTTVEHNIPVAHIYDDVTQLWGQTKTAATPTLIVSYGGNSGENYWYQHTNVWEHPVLKHFVPRTVLDPASRRRVMSPDNEWNHMREAEVQKKLQDAGVLVTVGAHGQREGLGAHWEMWMLSQGGMSNKNVLRAATLDGAKALGYDKEIGSLENGKLADLIVLESNPLENIRMTEHIAYVMVNGDLYSVPGLNQITPEPKSREAFWFEPCLGQPGPDLECQQEN